jgi:hypothetical protein
MPLTINVVKVVDYILADPSLVSLVEEDNIMILLAAFGAVPSVKQTALVAFEGFDECNGLYCITDVVIDMVVLTAVRKIFNDADLGDVYLAQQTTSPKLKAEVDAVMYGTPRFDVISNSRPAKIVITALELEATTGTPEVTTPIDVAVEAPEMTTGAPEELSEAPETIPDDKSELSGLGRTYEQMRCIIM